MPRRYRKSNPTQHLIILSSLIGLAIVGAQFAANTEPLADIMKYALFTFLTLLVIAASVFAIWRIIAYFTSRQRATNFASLRAHNVDNMTGKEFEIFLEHLLTARGFKVKNVYHSNDGGVDLVAKKNKDTYSIQAKRYNQRKKSRPPRHYRRDSRHEIPRLYESNGYYEQLLYEGGEGIWW